MIEKFNAEYIPGGAAQNTARVTQVCSIDIIIMLVYIMYYYNGQIIISKGFDIHRQVKINDNNERRFGVVMTPFSSSKMKRINCQKKFA